MIAPFSFVQEYEYNTVLAGIILSLCATKKIDCQVFLRDKKNIRRTYDRVRDYGPDATVELHFNSYFTEHVKGHSVLYSQYNSRSRELADSINEWLSTVVVTKDRGAKPLVEGARGFTNVSQLSTPSVIVEPFFGSNMDDAQEGLQNIHPIGDAIIDGVAHFVSREQNVPETSLQ